MVAAAQEPVPPEDKGRRKRAGVFLPDASDVPSKLARGGIVFAAEIPDSGYVFRLCSGRDAFGENADGVFTRADVARRGVAANDVVVERTLNIPALSPGHLGEMLRAIQPLLFSCDCKKYDGSGELVLA